MDGGSKGKQEKKSRVKVEKDVSKGDNTRKVKVEKTVHTKTEPGKQVTVETTKKTVEKRERKVYDLPGQKHDPLDERDGLRVFYESLYNQRPESHMAQIWMMEYGLLDRDEAQEVFDKVKAKKIGGTNYVTPAKPSGARGAVSNGAKKTPPAKQPEPKKAKSQDKEKPKPASNGKTAPRSAPKAKRKYAESEDEDDDEEVIPQKKVRGAY